MSGGSIILLILLVVISALSSSKKQQRKSSQNQRQGAGASAPVAEAPKVKPSISRAAADERFPDLSSAKTYAAKKAEYSQKRSAASGSMSTASTEGMSFGGSFKPAPQAVLSHTVQPMTESTHSHTESSITGIEDACTPQGDAAVMPSEAYVIKDPSSIPCRHFPFDRGSLRQGFLYGEILSKPKALRR